LYKKATNFTSGNLFYSFYISSFCHKNIYGQKLSKTVFIEKAISSFLFKKGFFINNFFFQESSTHSFIFFEVYSTVNNIFLDKKFIKVINYLQCHLESVFFDKKPIQIHVFNLNRRIEIKINKVNKLFINNFNITGSKNFLEIGFINNFYPCANLFSKVGSYYFSNIVGHGQFFNYIDELFIFLYNIRDSKFKGIRLEVRGRLNSSDRTKTKVCSQGSLPLQNLSGIYLN